MNINEKAIWLQVHYHPYHLGWYLSNPNRLEAIFEREYAKYAKQQEEILVEREKSDLDKRIRRLISAYFTAYGRDYSEDMSNNRHEANERAMAIRQQWI